MDNKKYLITVHTIATQIKPSFKTASKFKQKNHNPQYPLKYHTNAHIIATTSLEPA